MATGGDVINLLWAPEINTCRRLTALKKSKLEPNLKNNNTRAAHGGISNDQQGNRKKNPAFFYGINKSKVRKEKKYMTPMPTSDLCHPTIG